MGKIGQWLRRFMYGRYGNDRLNMFLLGTGVVICLISMFVGNLTANLILTAISYALMIWAIIRSMSKNKYLRYQENRKFLSFKNRLKDRSHRYFKCPKCRQSVRVPRHKGKIAITCPKCRERFIKKT